MEFAKRHGAIIAVLAAFALLWGAASLVAADRALDANASFVWNIWYRVL